MTGPSIAVFGAGLVGARHVVQAAEQANLAAVVDPSPAAAALAAKYGAPHFDDPMACLDAMQPDGVVIATPNALHADHALPCLARGIPVLIEKPIADTLANADRIVEASARHYVPVLVGHHRRHNPIIEQAKATIAEGALGDIVAVAGQFWLYKPDDYFDVGWRTRAGGGPIMINCIHDIDLLRYLVGEVDEIRAMRSSAQRGQAVEDTAAILIRFASGALGTFSVSDTVVAPWSWELSSGENPMYPHLPESCYRIGGTKAGLSLSDLRLWQHDGPRSWWSPMTQEQITVHAQDAFVRQFSHFIAVIGGTEPRVSASEGRASLAATLRCLAGAG